MRRIFLLVMIIFSSLIFVGCANNNASRAESGQSSQEVSAYDKVQEGMTDMNIKKLKITVGDRVMYANVQDNATSRALIETLPTTLTMDNLYSREMCYRYGAGTFPVTNSSSKGYAVGDIVYWPPRGSFVILYKQNGEHFDHVPIAHIDGDVSFFENMDSANVIIEVEP